VGSTRGQVDVALAGRKSTVIGCFSCYPDAGYASIMMTCPASSEDSHGRHDGASHPHLSGHDFAAKFIDRLRSSRSSFIMDERGLLAPLVRFHRKCSWFSPRIAGPAQPDRRFSTWNAWSKLHSEFCGALLRPAVFSVLLTRKYPERVRQVLDFARMAGEELVKLGSVTASTLQAVAEDICTPEELMATANAYWDRELGGPADEPA
jgi:hypothetical protein